MKTSIVSIGNSQGIRIPKLLLEESGLGKDVELEVSKGEIRIVPAISTKSVNDGALLSEKTLATDWNRKEEDEAWMSLQ
ncbi:MAG: Transcriptional regulator/antitoxin, MazE [Candidatus Gottesmanbacteria bacterium GW2011_GWA1_43_11]|uniref:Transcriptional regulator/antitoxin, MazE n=1 Tax=Candidatus Gottesmanbacteria bacterium GW2011_GWA1_43_11 TaxID=1618436 RepID=A0A0G1CJG2_9BACT|nr:MAG: Transcriptional regulator/antitoxin, MazE [Candidatus Gottesmanbacteria bacterium GW2011_GWA1_43_11]